MRKRRKSIRGTLSGVKKKRFGASHSRPSIGNYAYHCKKEKRTKTENQPPSLPKNNMGETKHQPKDQTLTKNLNRLMNLVHRLIFPGATMMTCDFTKDLWSSTLLIKVTIRTTTISMRSNISDFLEEHTLVSCDLVALNPGYLELLFNGEFILVFSISMD
jgi:hypothetical protein